MDKENLDRNMDDAMAKILKRIDSMTDEEFDIEFNGGKGSFEKKYYEEKRYLTGLDGIMLHIHSESEDWTDDIDELFNFIYNNGGDIDFYGDEDDLCVKYKGSYYILSEMHGQGCYKSISKSEIEPSCYVKFEDVVEYYETGRLPYKSNILSLIYRGLIAIEAVNGTSLIEINEERFDLDIVFDDIVEMLRGI